MVYLLPLSSALHCGAIVPTTPKLKNRPTILLNFYKVDHTTNHSVKTLSELLLAYLGHVVAQKLPNVTIETSINAL